MTIVSVYALFGSPEEADRIGRQCVEEHLAACVNIVGPCRSIYRWQGAIETSDEVAAIFKTSEAAADALMDRIAEMHSYEVPAIAVWPIAKSPDSYVAWVKQNVG